MRTSAHLIRSTVFIATFVLVACHDATAPGDGTGARYVSAMMDIMQSNSINRNKINWTTFRAQVSAAIPANASISGSNAAITLALQLLGDNHSRYISKSGAPLYASTLDCSAPTISGVPALESDIGYVRVRNFDFLPGSPQALAFTDSMVGAIRAGDSPQVHGWIVDLRGNTGGNMYPMVSGVGPILGATTVAGYFIDANSVATPWGYNGSASTLGGFVMQPTTTPYTLISPSPRVAILLDKAVASSGEAAAISFKQRPSTRFFGTATCGLSSGNALYTLSDGATLALTTAIDADRNSIVYGGPILPDTVITDTSAVVPAAVAWLRSPHP